MVKWFFLSLNFTWAIKYWVLKVNTYRALSFTWHCCLVHLFLERRLDGTVIDVTWEHTVAMSQLRQFRAKDVRPIKSDKTFHLHHIWEWISLGKQLNLWYICLHAREKRNRNFIKDRNTTERRLTEGFYFTSLHVSFEEQVLCLITADESKYVSLYVIHMSYTHLFFFCVKWSLVIVRT